MFHVKLFLDFITFEKFDNLFFFFLCFMLTTNRKRWQYLSYIVCDWLCLS